MTSNDSFLHFTFAGGPKSRGSQYGEALRDRIRTTYDLYATSLFAGSSLSTEQIRDRADRVRKVIEKFSPDYVVELDALAAAANLPSWQIYVLNARTEILNAPIGECTALYFADSRLLGQNWDWVSALEDLAILVTWETRDGLKALTFTEPGMLGKIGFNDRGLGVCLNIMFSPHELNGVPVHILTRALLDCATLDEAQTMLTRSGFGKSSNLLIGDALGNAFSVEFAAGEAFEVRPTNGVLLHTNHCIAPGAEHKTALIPTTVQRLEQGQEWLESTATRDLGTMKQVLLDDSRGDTSINLCYHPEPLLDNKDVGTCATIVMDLQRQQMTIKKGPGSQGRFVDVPL